MWSVAATRETQTRSRGSAVMPFAFLGERVMPEWSSACGGSKERQMIDFRAGQRVRRGRALMRRVVSTSGRPACVAALTEPEPLWSVSNLGAAMGGRRVRRTAQQERKIVPRQNDDACVHRLGTKTAKVDPRPKTQDQIRAMAKSHNLALLGRLEPTVRAKPTHYPPTHQPTNPPTLQPTNYPPTPTNHPPTPPTNQTVVERTGS